MSFWTVPRSRGLHPLAATDRLVQGQQDGGRGVDRHRRAHRAEVDAVQQPLHVVDGVDRHPDAAHLAGHLRVVAVVAHLGRQVEGHRQPGLASRQQVPESTVRLPAEVNPAYWRMVHGRPR